MDVVNIMSDLTIFLLVDAFLGAVELEIALNRAQEAILAATESYCRDFSAPHAALRLSVDLADPGYEPCEQNRDESVRGR